MKIELSHIIQPLLLKKAPIFIIMHTLAERNVVGDHPVGQLDEIVQ